MTTTAVRSSAVSLNVPPTQNTAPVHEYRCLWTQDVRRKQKRWQDGRLKFHTFNKRLMLYDDALTYVGDTHWKQAGDLVLDHEVILDIGVLIQIGERTATTQTDLTPLFDKEARKTQQAAAKESAKRRGLGTDARTLLGGKSNLQKSASGESRKHRSLNALLGSDRASFGRASFPAKSPYDVRKGDQEIGTAGERAPKRQKPMVHRTAVSETKTHFPTTPSRVILAGENVRRGQTSATHNPATESTGLGHNCRVVIPSGSDNQPWSDVTLPSSPHRHGDTLKQALPKSRPTDKALMLPPKTPLAQIPRPDRSGSPPISTRSHIRQVDTEAEVVIIDDDDGIAVDAPSANQGPKAAKTKSLLIAKSRARPMLVCQNPAGITPSKIMAVPRKKRNGQNLYRTLSQLEEEAEAEKGHVPRVPVHRVGKVQAAKPKPGNKQSTEVLPVELSSETAFEAVSSPPRSRPAPQLSHDRTKTVVPTLEQCRELRNEASGKNATVIDDREDSGIALEQDFANGRRPSKAKSSRLTTLSAKAAKSKSAVQKAPRNPAKHQMDNQSPSRGKSKSKEEQGPWTVEAMDLFDWRPPDWEARTKLGP